MMWMKLTIEGMEWQGKGWREPVSQELSLNDYQLALLLGTEHIDTD